MDSKPDGTSKFETLKDLLFGTWDRKYAFIAVTLSVISTLFGLYTIISPSNLSPLIPARDLIVVIVLMGSVAYLLRKYILGEETRKNMEMRLELKIDQLESHLQDRTKHLLYQIRNSYIVVHASIGELFKYYKSTLSHSAELEVTEDQFEAFEKICLYITQQVKDSFTEYFRSRQIDIGDDIAVAVKLVLAPTVILNLYGDRLDENERLRLRNSKSGLAITVYRDPDTYRRNQVANEKQREIGLKLYDVQQNTAFSNIMVVKKPYFLCNDLKGLSGYNNENPDWAFHYNATLVVPIALEDIYHPILFGFLAVDSKNEKSLELYNNKECLYILCHAADMLCNYFLAAVLHHFVES